MLYIGIDIGTSSAKLTLINEVGKIVNEVSKEYHLSEPISGWKEINPEIWMNTVENLIPMLLKDTNSYDVNAIGVTGQMHTIVLLDQNGMVIRPALMWNDTRTKTMLAEMKRRIKSISQVAYIANILSTGSPAINLLWVKEQEYDSFQKINKFLIGPDYITYQLTGNYQTDYCEASTSSLFDFNTRKWSKDIQEEFGFPSAIFPEIKATKEVAGQLTKKWAKQFHMRTDVNVIVGTGDNPAAAISTGCFSKKYPVLSIGTSGILMFPKDSVDFKDKGKNIVVSLDNYDRMVLVQGAIQSAGSSMSWWTRKILHSNEVDETTNGIDVSTLGENKLMFYPHLAGDKTIYADPNLTGAFIGLQTSTTRTEMSVAIMEGIAMAVKQLSEEMNISHEKLAGLRVTGGGSKNEIWMQIMADVLDVEIQQLESGTGAGYGIALVAASLNEQGLSLEEIIEHNVRIKKRYVPRNHHTQLYQKKYQQYLKMYQAMQLINE